MIDIAPKALRCARLAAEQRPEFAADPEVAIIREKEAAFRARAAEDRTGRYVEIAESTASFCVRVMATLLDQPETFDSADWDGNDFVLFQETVASLRQQLTRAKAHSL